MPFNNPIAGGLDLIREALQSPDYEAGVSGWSINKDGSAEFNGVTFRGSLHSEDPETGASIDISAGEILIDNGTLNAFIIGNLTQGLLISSNLGITIVCPDGILTFNAPELDLNADTGMNINGDLLLRTHPVASFMDILSAPASNTDTTSTGGEATMTGTEFPTQSFLDDHIYRATYHVQYDANGSGGVGCSVRFRVRLGTDTSGTFVGGTTTPVLTKMYGSFLPTCTVIAIWKQNGDLDSSVVLTMQREQQSTGTVIGELSSTDFYASVEDLGPAAFL